MNEAIALRNLGLLALLQEDYCTAYAQCAAGLAVARAVGDIWAVSLSLNALANTVLHRGDLATARKLTEEAVVLHRHLGERFLLAYCLDIMGQVATAEGQYVGARAALRESLHLSQDMGNPAGTADTLESIAALAATETHPEPAVQLAGAAAGIREQVGAQQSPMRRATLDHWLAAVRQALGAETTTLAWEAGRGMAIEQAVDLALTATVPPRDRARSQIARRSRSRD